MSLEFSITYSRIYRIRVSGWVANQTTSLLLKTSVINWRDYGYFDLSDADLNHVIFAAKASVP